MPNPTAGGGGSSGGGFGGTNSAQQRGLIGESGSGRRDYSPGMNGGVYEPVLADDDLGLAGFEEGGDLI